MLGFMEGYEKAGPQLESIRAALRGVEVQPTPNPSSPGVQHKQRWQQRFVKTKDVADQTSLFGSVISRAPSPDFTGLPA